MRPIASRHDARDAIPAKAGTQRLSCGGLGASEEQSHWVPAFAGMTSKSEGTA